MNYVFNNKKNQTLTLKPKKAKKDIIVYKILVSSLSLGGNLYFTPFTNCAVNIKKPFICNIFDTPQLSDDKEYIIIFGIHTYKNLRFIKKQYDIPPTPLYLSWVVFKCIIPKGTLYWVGKNGEYASERIEFVEQIY